MCPGATYSNMVHCFRPLFDAEHTDYHILSLEAFFKPESEKKTDLTTAHGAW
jgi:hypothetical protein